jgi:hypothetical protein
VIGVHANVVRIAAGLAVAAALAQRSSRFEPAENVRPTFPAQAEFHFIRMEYTDHPMATRRFGYSSRSGAGAGWWRMDWPDAEDHFTLGVRRLTRIVAGEPRHFRLTDDQLWDYPWLYATQVGWWDLSDAEVKRLRDYLLRGGFLVVDDFYGPEQWDAFRHTMERTFPEQPIVDVAESDSLRNVLYTIGDKDLTFIPGSRHLRRSPGREFLIEQPEGTVPAWRGIYDSRGRMIVLIQYNMDVADAWEFADWPEYPEHKTTLAYRYGINAIVYSMTH